MATFRMFEVNALSTKQLLNNFWGDFLEKLKQFSGRRSKMDCLYKKGVNRHLKCFNSKFYCPGSSHLGHLKCICGRLEQRFKLALPVNIEHRFCDTSFKTLQSKRSFISTSLAIFIFLTTNKSKWETNSRFHKRFHHYRAALLFRGCRFCFPWVHKIQNNDFKNIDWL